MATTRTHYLGTPYASSAACGRQVIVYAGIGPRTTADATAVTCRACLARMR